MMVRLGDIGTIITGNTPKTSDNKYYDSNDICFIKPSDIDDSKVTDLYSSEYHISEYARNKARILPAHSVLVTCIGIVGKVGINSIECAFNQQINAIIPNAQICNYRYLAYAIQHEKPKLQNIANAPVVPILNKSQFSDIEISLLPYEEQSRIATILDKVSDLISKHRRQLDKLNDLIKSRFVEMFGNETELDRWLCGIVADVADVRVGVVIKPTQYYAEEGIPAFRSLNIGEFGIKDADWVYFTEEGNRKNQKSIVRKNDVLIVRSGAPGTACVVTEKYSGYNAVDIIIARPDITKINPIFLATFTNMPHGMNQIRKKTGGAAQQHFGVGGYNELQLIIPPIALQNEFAAFVHQVDKLKLSVRKSLDKMELLQAALMQKYFGRGGANEN